MYKIKNNDDFIIFYIYPDFSFHNLSNCIVLNIGDSSIRCLEKNIDVYQQIQTLIVKTDHLILKLGSKKLNPIAVDELHNLILNWSGVPIILF